MKILKVIGIILLLVVVVVVIGMFVAPTEMSYEKSISINAPVDVVWENTNSLEDMNIWSPWTKKDPNMSEEMSGTPGTVGSMHSWDSEVETVGKGSQAITGIDAPNRIDTELIFYTPYESKAQAYVALVAEGDGTKATWGFYSETPRPMNLFMMFMDMEDLIGEDYQQGLNSLKAMSEEDKMEMDKKAIEEAMMVADTVSVE